MESLKSAVLLANEPESDQKKMSQMIVVKIFAMYSFTQKRLCRWNARKCSIKQDFNRNGSFSFS